MANLKWMEDGLKKPGKTKGGLAKAMRMRASAISELLDGKRQMKLDEALDGINYLELPITALGDVKKYVVPNEPAPFQIPMIAPVRGRAAAGVWLEFDASDEERYAEIPYVPSRYPSLPQFAYRIAGNSMVEEQINDGDYVICVEFSIARAIPQAGDVVVAERRRGGLMERTCKLVADGKQKGSLMLVSRSPDPRYKDPIILGNDTDETEVEIMGLVVGTYRPRF